MGVHPLLPRQPLAILRRRRAERRHPFIRHWRFPMALDVNPLVLVPIYIESLLGLLLLFAWVQNTEIHAVAWWASAHFLRAASITLFGAYGEPPDVPHTVFAH